MFNAPELLMPVPPAAICTLSSWWYALKLFNLPIESSNLYMDTMLPSDVGSHNVILPLGPLETRLIFASGPVKNDLIATNEKLMKLLYNNMHLQAIDHRIVPVFKPDFL